MSELATNNTRHLKSPKQAFHTNEKKLFPFMPTCMIIVHVLPCFLVFYDFFNILSLFKTCSEM